MKFKKGVGQLEKVPIREVFPHEAHDFTVWLAKNLDALKRVGFDFTLEKTEYVLGDLRADIVCLDNLGNRVVIENQLEACDDDHFVRIVRYMGKLKANTAIWITPEPTDKHQELVQTLNAQCRAGIGYYLVRVETFRIDGSRPYPFFTTLVRPREDVDGIPEIVMAETEAYLSESEPEAQIEAPRIDLPSVWCIYPRHDEETYNLFLHENIFGTGLGSIGDLRKIAPKPDAFREAFARKRLGESPARVRTFYPMFYSLIHRVTLGDLVIYAPTWRERKIHVGEVIGDYEYRHRQPQGYCDIRPVKWIKSFPRENFSVNALRGIAVSLAFFQVRNETFLNELAAKLSDNGAI